MYLYAILQLYKGKKVTATVVWALSEVPLTKHAELFFALKLYDAVKRTWYEARDYCRAIGGDLVSIHSADDQTHLPTR